jgi:hypothetical protein
MTRPLWRSTGVRNVGFESTLAIHGLPFFSAGVCVGQRMLIVGAVDQPLRGATDVTSGRAGHLRDSADVYAQGFGQCSTVAGQGYVGHPGGEFDW